MIRSDYLPKMTVAHLLLIIIGLLIFLVYRLQKKVKRLETDMVDLLLWREQVRKETGKIFTAVAKEIIIKTK